MGKMALLFAFLRKIILEIPALFLLNWLFPLYGLAYAQLAAEFVLAFVAAVTLAKLFSGWQENVLSRRCSNKNHPRLLTCITTGGGDFQSHAPAVFAVLPAVVRSAFFSFLGVWLSVK